MGITKTKLVALIAGTSLVAMLGLAACSGSSSTSTSSNASSTSASASSDTSSTASTSDAPESSNSAAASASASSSGTVSLEALAKDLFQNCLVGQDGKGVIYFYSQGENDKTASLLVYDVTNDAFSVHAGAYEEPSVGKVRIDMKGAGEALEFKVTPNADLTAVDFTFDNGTTVTMGPVIDEDTEQLLKELDQLIAKVNNSAEAK